MMENPAVTDAPVEAADTVVVQPADADSQDREDRDEIFEAKLETLKEILSGCEVAVAGYCGDASSSLLAACLAEALPEGAASFVFADGFLYSDEYRDVVLSNAALLEIPLQVVGHQGFSKPAVLRNEVLRCYRCRVGLFDSMLDVAPVEGATLLMGYTADRMENAVRGRKAMTEYGVETPLAQAGITTAEARAWAAERGLAPCPPLECVAVRFELNDPVSEGMACAFADTDRAVRETLRMPTAKVFNEGGLTSVVMPYSALRRSSEWEVPVSDIAGLTSADLASDAAASTHDGGAPEEAEVEACVPTALDVAGYSDLESTDLELEGVLATVNRAIGGGGLDELLDARRKHDEELARAMEELVARRQAAVEVAQAGVDADDAGDGSEQGVLAEQVSESEDAAAAGTQPPVERERPARVPTVEFLERVQELLGGGVLTGGLVLETSLGRRARRSAAVKETPMDRRRR